MSDRMLAAGEQVVFRLAISGGTPSSGGRDTYIDNVAVTASQSGGPVEQSVITHVHVDGSNGVADAFYVVVNAPELAIPTTRVPIETNTFEAGGLFSVTNMIEAGTSQSFYRIEMWYIPEDLRDGN